MRSALHFGSGMLGSYAGIVSEKGTSKVKYRSQKICRSLKVAVMGSVEDALPVGPALSFLAKKKQKQICCHCHWNISCCSLAAVNSINMCQMFLNTDQVSHR